ncbi:MAG TPA: hypothetical protein DCE41_16485 [Cytophagales bacterium]|nr:hypothetical protein [Cytophagales bacterium]
MARQILPLFVLILVLGSCATGKRALEQGNYYEAVTQAIERLRQNPDSKKATATLRDGYSLATKYYTDQITVANNSSDPFRYESIMNSYGSLNALYEAIQRCPACQKIIPNAREYTRQYEQVRMQAAEARYNAAMASLDENNRERSKDAYWNFDRVEQILPGFRDARERREQALDYASLHVVVDVAPVPGRYELSNEFFANKVFQAIDGPAVNRFVRFYSVGEADRLRLDDPDHVLVMQFDDFVVGETHTNRSTETFSRDSVNTGSVKVNGETVPVYSTVEARLSVFTRTVVSRGLLDMRVYDGNTRRVLMQQKMPGEFAWSTQWARYQGDERALNGDQKDLCDLDEAFPPSPQQMFIEFTRPIYDQAVGHIRRFYANY